MSASIFPALIGSLLEIDRTPVYDTTVQRESGGRELRIRRQAGARYKYRVDYDFLRQDAGGDELATLMNFFATHKGAWDSFLFVDPKDSTATALSFGTGNGAQTVFYLRDEMGDRIGACAAAPLIYKGGTLQTVTTHYTIDIATGTVTFVSAPAAGQALTWTGTYYRRCRFANDSISVQRRYSRVWKASVELISVLP